MTAALEIEDVSKVFRLFRERPSSLKQRVLSGRMRVEEFWALRDIAFDVQEGSSLGLIGHNGSGKTTLLKCIAGILRPTSGVIRYRGRVAALLELGAGFHPELTGAENIALYASVLGITRRELAARYDEIVEFAAMSDFLDTPLKYYSSGMEARLAFSVSVCLQPDILLLDEVLAVGDQAFRERCLHRLRAYHDRGGTLILVSHELDQVRALCQRGIWLERGEVVRDGPIDEVLAAYRAKPR